MHISQNCCAETIQTGNSKEQTDRTRRW